MSENIRVIFQNHCIYRSSDEKVTYFIDLYNDRSRVYRHLKCSDFSEKRRTAKRFIILPMFNINRIFPIQRKIGDIFREQKSLLIMCRKENNSGKAKTKQLNPISTSAINIRLQNVLYLYASCLYRSSLQLHLSRGKGKRIDAARLRREKEKTEESVEGTTEPRDTERIALRLHQARLARAAIRLRRRFADLSLSVDRQQATIVAGRRDERRHRDRTPAARHPRPRDGPRHPAATPVSASRLSWHERHIVQRVHEHEVREQDRQNEKEKRERERE